MDDGQVHQPAGREEISVTMPRLLLPLPLHQEVNTSMQSQLEKRLGLCQAAPGLSEQAVPPTGESAPGDAPVCLCQQKLAQLWHIH